jgi:hypothetical protein
MGRLDEFPADVTPVAIFAKGEWPRRIETLRGMFPEEKYVIHEDEDGTVKIYDRTEAVEAIHNPPPDRDTHAAGDDIATYNDQRQPMQERLAAWVRVHQRK